MQRIISFFLFSISLVVSAADHSGTYIGDLSVSGNKVENKLVLKITGNTLTGTLTNQFGELPLQQGAADGQDFFFYVIVKDEGEDFKMIYRGHIFEDEIQFRVEAGERQIDLVVKKVS